MDRCLGTGDPLMKKEEKCLFIKKNCKEEASFEAQNSQSIVSQQTVVKKKKRCTGGLPITRASHLLEPKSIFPVFT